MAGWIRRALYALSAILLAYSLWALGYLVIGDRERSNTGANAANVLVAMLLSIIIVVVAAGWLREDPPWWFRDGVIALVIGTILLVGQVYLDDERQSAELSRADDALAQAAISHDLQYLRSQVATGGPVILPGADLREANLRRLNLADADLRGGELFAAQLDGTSLRGANLSETIMASAEGADVDLLGANVRGALMTGLHLERSDLTGVDMGCIEEFSCTRLDDSFFSDSHFDGADLAGAVLRSASISGGSFQGADLRGADLTGASFWRVDLSQALLNSDAADNLCYAYETRWPSNVDAPHEVEAYQLPDDCPSSSDLDE